MGASVVDHRSSFALEWSLRKSFSAIHRTPYSGWHTILQDSVLKRDRRGKIIQSKSCLRGNRRHSVPTTMLSPTSSRDVVTPSDYELPPLPFSKDTSVEQPQRESSRECSAKKFQRRYAHKKSAERRRVSFAPSPSSSIEDDNQQSVEVEGEQQNMGFRKDYSLGETTRSRCHMIIEPTSVVSSLKKHDFAFVKRSDGSYSYAILACRLMEPIKGTNNTEECMTFVMSDVGATKIVRKSNWSEYIRLVSMKEL